jgi:hypothetical protein
MPRRDVIVDTERLMSKNEAICHVNSAARSRIWMDFTLSAADDLMSIGGFIRISPPAC